MQHVTASHASFSIVIGEPGHTKPHDKMLLRDQRTLNFLSRFGVCQYTDKRAAKAS